MSQTVKSTAFCVAVLLLALCALPALADDQPPTNPPSSNASEETNGAQRATRQAPSAQGAPESTTSEPAAPEHRRTAHKKLPPPILQPLPPGPLRQVPMDQIPESAPQVTFENGRLTIVAQNATLGEILKQVRELTGASIDLPQGGAPERVVTHLGPGAPRDVLAVLLNGTNFNYVMLGSSTDPTAIASVILSPKPGGAAEQPPPQQSQTVANNGYQQPAPSTPFNPALNGAFRRPLVPNAAASHPEPAPAAAETADNSADDSDDKDDDSEQNQPSQANATPSADANNNNSASSDQPQPANPNQPNAGPKTPEQLLQMMRQAGQPGAAMPPPPPQQQ